MWPSPEQTHTEAGLTVKLASFNRENILDKWSKCSSQKLEHTSRSSKYASQHDKTVKWHSLGIRTWRTHFVSQKPWLYARGSHRGHKDRDLLRMLSQPIQVIQSHTIQGILFPFAFFHNFLSKRRGTPSSSLSLLIQIQIQKYFICPHETTEGWISSSMVNTKTTKCVRWYIVYK